MLEPFLRALVAQHTATFFPECYDECAGYFVSRLPVAPVFVETIADPIGELLRLGAPGDPLPGTPSPPARSRYRAVLPREPPVRLSEDRTASPVEQVTPE